MKYILPSLLLIVSCTTHKEVEEPEVTHTPSIENPAPGSEVTISEDGEICHPDQKPVSSELDMLSNGIKLNTCYKMSVVHDSEQGVVCYIVVSQCSSSVPSMSCVKTQR